MRLRKFLLLIFFFHFSSFAWSASDVIQFDSWGSSQKTLKVEVAVNNQSSEISVSVEDFVKAIVEHEIGSEAYATGNYAVTLAQGYQAFAVLARTKFKSLLAVHSTLSQPGPEVVSFKLSSLGNQLPSGNKMAGILQAIQGGGGISPAVSAAVDATAYTVISYGGRSVSLADWKTFITAPGGLCIDRTAYTGNPEESSKYRAYYVDARSSYSYQSDLDAQGHNKVAEPTGCLDDPARTGMSEYGCMVLANTGGIYHWDHEKILRAFFHSSPPALAILPAL